MTILERLLATLGIAFILCTLVGGAIQIAKAVVAALR